MRAFLWLVASAFVVSVNGYYPYDLGCSDCQRPPQCPPCPAPPACSSRFTPNLQHVTSNFAADCGKPPCTGEFSPLTMRKTPDVAVVNEGAIGRKYPQARILEVDGGFAQSGGDEQIEEEVTSEAPFFEHSPPTPPPVAQSADVVEASAEVSHLPPYLSRLMKARAAGVRRRVTRKAPFKCNDERLRIIMHQSMDAGDLTFSKRSIVNEAERVLFGKFNVICSPTRLSYVAQTKKYCEVTLPDIVCLAFMH